MDPGKAEGGCVGLDADESQQPSWRASFDKVVERVEDILSLEGCRDNTTVGKWTWLRRSGKKAIICEDYGASKPEEVIARIFEGGGRKRSQEDVTWYEKSPEETELPIVLGWGGQTLQNIELGEAPKLLRSFCPPKTQGNG